MRTKHPPSKFTGQTFFSPHSWFSNFIHISNLGNPILDLFAGFIDRSQVWPIVSGWLLHGLVWKLHVALSQPDNFAARKGLEHHGTETLLGRQPYKEADLSRVPCRGPFPFLKPKPYFSVSPSTEKRVNIPCVMHNKFIIKIKIAV